MSSSVFEAVTCAAVATVAMDVGLLIADGPAALLGVRLATVFLIKG